MTAAADPDSIPCECGHMRGIHKAREPHPCAAGACGCGRFRVRTPASSPEPPRVIAGHVERELLPGAENAAPVNGSSPSPEAADAVSRFSRHLRGRMRALGWDAAALAGHCGLSAHVVGRAVNGTSVEMGTAEKIACTVGSGLLAMIGPYRCGTCDGEPPAGFRCLECGTEAIGART